MKTKLLLYCTKGKSSLNLWRAIGIKEDVHKAILSISEYQEDTELDDFMNVEFVKKYPKYAGERIIFRPTNLNGKIVAECECEVEEISCKIGSPFPYLEFEHELPKTCLTEEELENYLNYKVGYALHLTNIKAFEKPLDLKECKTYKKFYNSKNTYNIVEKVLTNAPQNAMWVWYKGQKYCLISIRPEWLCKILNGEKTIEVRRKILKGMM